MKNLSKTAKFAMLWTAPAFLFIAVIILITGLFLLLIRFILNFSGTGEALMYLITGTQKKLNYQSFLKSLKDQKKEILK